MISRRKAVTFGLLGCAFGALLLATILPSKNELVLPDGSRLTLLKTVWNKPIEEPPRRRTESLLLRYVPEKVWQFLGIHIPMNNVGPWNWAMGGTNMLGFLFLQTGCPKRDYLPMASSVVILYTSDLPIRLIDDAGVEGEKVELGLFPWRPGCNYLATAVRLRKEHGRNITLRIYKRSQGKSDPVFGPSDSDYQTKLGDFTVRNPAF